MVSFPGNAFASPASSTGPAPLSSNQTWAYGGLKQVHLGRNVGSPLSSEYAYSVNATFGFAVILNETQTPQGAYLVTLSRVMGSDLKVDFCRPSCTRPIATGSIVHRAWEATNASVLLVANGTVTLAGGSDVAALALASSSIQISAGVRESEVYALGGTLQRSDQLAADLEASDQLNLTPPLGLFPLNVTAGETWTANSSFVQIGQYNWSLDNRVTGASVPLKNFSRSGNGSLNATGNLTLSGDDTPTPVRLGGTLYQALNLSVSGGPFVLREGMLLLPRPADLFGAADQAWLPNETGFANATQVNVEIQREVTGAPGHLGLGGSGEVWFARSLNPLFPHAGSPLSPAVSAAPSVSGSNVTYVQGVPESPSQAASDQNCLLTGTTGCPVGSAPVKVRWGVVVLAGASVVVAVLAAALVVGKRRRLPPPVFPNAALYPPGGPAGTRTGAAAAERPVSPEQPPTPSDEEEDPLGHLW